MAGSRIPALVEAMSPIDLHFYALGVGLEGVTDGVAYRESILGLTLVLRASNDCRSWFDELDLVSIG